MPNNAKKNKAGLLALFQNIAEFVGIFTYLLFSVIFAWSFGKNVYLFFTGYIDSEALVKKSLSAFELLFVAPIPVLVIFAFKAILVRIYPAFFKDPEDDHMNMLKLDYAKKTFVSSIIGVAGISILTMFLDENAYGGYKDMKVALAILFLVILIGYYYILSGHSKD